MKWTKDKPILIGEWYWYRESDVDIKNTPIPVFLFDKDTITVDAVLFPIEEWEGEYSHCPIPVPEED